ncbi:hypothetical protein [Plantactinospora sp. GCM10030261]|uniref:hypothetical protein n=1 Tax=Plantactinospora sp. GCM10030261 TaxID=3273420 RepID=UPI0036063DF5
MAPATARPASEATRPAGDTAPRTRTSAALRVLDDPGRAPELIALAAVDLLGPPARNWVERTRAARPEAGPDELTRLAAARFTRLVGVGGALAARTGVLAPVAEIATVTWAHASLVLHVAAAHGHDPTDPERAVDLLVLTGVHQDAPAARAALGAVDTDHPVLEPPLLRLAVAGRRLAGPFVNRLAGWLALRFVVRGIPGAAPFTAAVGYSMSARRLAARAATRFQTTASPR